MESAVVLAGLRSGDGPLSVRARPSSIKHDCDPRPMSPGGKCLVNVDAKSCLIVESTADTRSATKGQAGACPDRARAIPCTVRVATGPNRSYATADDVPVACPIGRSAAGTYGHSGTTRPIGSPANRQADPLRKPDLLGSGSAVPRTCHTLGAPAVNDGNKSRVQRAVHQPIRRSCSPPFGVTDLPSWSSDGRRV
jgi:hypothetical protein